MALAKFELTKELLDKQMQLLEKIQKDGKIKVGINEVTKMIERGNAKFVVIAQDVNPVEIIMHLPLLCEEKKVPYSFAPTKKELGAKAGVEVGTAAIVVIDEGDNKKELETLAKKIAELKK